MVEAVIARMLAAVAPQPARPHRPAHIKLVQPDPYDGETTTKFRPWWEAINEYLGYHRDLQDYERITFVGTRLTGKAMKWH